MFEQVWKTIADSLLSFRSIVRQDAIDRAVNSYDSEELQQHANECKQINQIDTSGHISYIAEFTLGENILPEICDKINIRLADEQGENTDIGLQTTPNILDNVERTKN